MDYRSNTELSSSSPSDHRLLLECGCGVCGFLAVVEWVEFDDEPPSEWFLDFFVTRRGPGSWLWRLGQIWNLILGREVSIHEISLRPEQVEDLLVWLNNRLST